MPILFRYAYDIRTRFPQLCSRALVVERIDAESDTAVAIARLKSIADTRLGAANEGEFPEIQAWRRAFSTMGLKPTQYRCAAEALLRRYRKEATLPALHPLIDLCNATSLAFAIPIAVFDSDKIAGSLEVRRASGDEIYETFSGEIENPEPGEIIFADDAGRAHARRWTNRQSGWSAFRSDATRALIVAEALHETAEDDIASLTSALVDTLTAILPGCIVTQVVPESNRHAL